MLFFERLFGFGHEVVDGVLMVAAPHGDLLAQFGRFIKHFF
jgi:hypothetical protein